MCKGYEKKYKVTRVLLADYQLLKELSRQAGISMADCLHKLITRQPEVARQMPVIQPAFEVRAQPTFEVTAPVVLRVRAEPTIATNGSKVTVFRIKPKGAKI